MRLMAWTVLLSVAGSQAACGSPAAIDKVDSAAPLDAGGADAGPAPPPSTASLFLTIDDMEERSDLPGLPPNSGGFWWPLGDGGGLGNWFLDAARSDGAPGPRDVTPDAIIPPRGDSKAARHVQSLGTPGAMDLFAQLKHPSNGAVDLAPYLGITFWAKLVSPSGRLIVGLRDPHGPPLLTTEAMDAQFAREVSVTDQWARFVLLFDDFHQGVISGNGADRPFTANAVATIDFVVGRNGEAFDLWIDDLALLCRGVCALRSF